MKWPLLHQGKNIPEDNSPGSFGFKRSYYYHPGVDLYCEEMQEVRAIEDGVVVNVEIFTGTNAVPTSPWWNETWSVLVEGKSGVIGYCEIAPHPRIKIGEQLLEGNFIGHVIPVLKKDKGNGQNMLHLELYKRGTISHVTWHLGEEKPEELLNPTDFIRNITESKYFCPCSSAGCCDNPKVFTPEHDCDDVDFCEGCFGKECENCGDYCNCDL